MAQSSKKDIWTSHSLMARCVKGTFFYGFPYHLLLFYAGKRAIGNYFYAGGQTSNRVITVVHGHCIVARFANSLPAFVGGNF